MILLKKDKTILQLCETPREQRHIISGQYPNVVEDKIYYQVDNPKEIHYAIWDGERYIRPSDNTVMRKSESAHNFKVFIDTNPKTPPKERYKAVGGYHVGMGRDELRDCPISNNLKTVPIYDPIWPDIPQSIFEDNFFHPRHANGLYVFVSSDGISWKEYHKKPIFSRFTQCINQNGDPEKNILGLDGSSSIFFDHNISKYVIYIRANIALGCRNVLYSHSDDLINWSTPQLITCDPKFDIKNKQNLYYPAVYPFEDRYIAFPPHFTSRILDKSGNNRTYENEHTPIMFSDDRLNWKTKHTILKCNTGKHLYQSLVASFTKEKNKYILYVQEGFQTPRNSLTRNEIVGDL